MPVSSSGISINAEMESKPLRQGETQNSCCFVTFRASGGPVSEEGRLIKEVNTQWVWKEVNTHGPYWFCPKTITAFRMWGSISKVWHLLWRERLQSLWSLNFIAGTKIGANETIGHGELGYSRCWSLNICPGQISSDTKGSRMAARGRSFLISWLLWQPRFLPVNTWVSNQSHQRQWGYDHSLE